MLNDYSVTSHCVARVGTVHMRGDNYNALYAVHNMLYVTYITSLIIQEQRCF